MPIRQWRRFRLLALLVVVTLLLSLTVGLVRASQEPSGLVGTSADNAYATCTATSDTIITCNLKVVADQSSLDLTADLLSLAQEVNSAITADTVMWLQAWGGQGGEGGDSLAKAGGGGLGGFAQTITTINDYQSSYGMTTLYYYLGGCCKNKATFWANGGGGASSIVAAASTNLSANNVLLIAGGGGGGNSPNGTTSGQSGGNGGSAIAKTAKSTYGAGQSLSGNNGTALGGVRMAQELVVLRSTRLSTAPAGTDLAAGVAATWVVKRITGPSGRTGVRAWGMPGMALIPATLQVPRPVAATVAVA